MLGLAHPVPPWPTPLADAGYALVRIEQPVTTEEGKVVVDQLFAARERNALLAVECKDGTVQEPQARRYEAMRPLDIVRTASVSLGDPSTAALDVAYAVPGRRVDETVSALRQSAPSLGVLGIDPEITWAGPRPKDAGLRSAFGQSIPVDPRAIPRLMLADEHSPPSAFVAAVANQLHAAFEEQRESVTIATLVERIFWGWPRYGRAFQGKLARKVEDLLRTAQSAELSGVIAVERTTREAPSPVVRLLPQSTDPSTQAGDLRASRALRGRFDDLVAKVTGRPVPPTPGQMQLVSDEFDDDDGVDEPE